MEEQLEQAPDNIPMIEDQITDETMENGEA